MVSEKQPAEPFNKWRFRMCVKIVTEAYMHIGREFLYKDFGDDVKRLYNRVSEIEREIETSFSHKYTSEEKCGHSEAEVEELLSNAPRGSR